MDTKGLTEFYSPAIFETATFSNFQEFDFEGLKGRLCSSSYTPNSTHPNHIPMMIELKRIFARYQVSGKVRFEYKTQVYYGHVLSR